MGKNENRINKGEHQDRCTPRAIWEPIVEVFGEIGLDPFGCPVQSLPARYIFALPEYEDTKFVNVYEDGLKVSVFIKDDSREQSWDGYGLVFCNGPWVTCDWWCEKAGNEGDEVILLVPARMNNVWFHDFIAPADAHYIPKRRLIFENAPQTTPPFHIMLAYWGERKELFEKCFEEREWWFL